MKDWKFKNELFGEYELNGNRVKNRIVRSATREYLFYQDGTLTEDYLHIYETLAQNEVGLIIAGVFKVNNSYVSALSQGSVDGIQYMPGMKKLADIAHRYGSIIYGQLSYYGHYDEVRWNTGLKIKIKEYYVKGAQLLMDAGFDGVQIHMAHSCFMSRYMEDGSREIVEDRVKLPCEIIKRIKEVCGKQFTVICKINSDRYSEKDLKLILMQMKSRGLDGVEVSGSDFSKRKKEETAYYEEAALWIRKKVNIPVILTGGNFSAGEMNSLIEEGIDLAGACRPFICEPDFAKKLRQPGYKAKCMRCGQCLTLQESAYKRCVFGEKIDFLQKTFGGK